MLPGPGMPKKPQPLTVDIPKPGRDNPVWSRVGVIAAVGFAIGVAWPKLLGFTIGPEVPGKNTPAKAVTAAPTAAPAAPKAQPQGPEAPKVSNKQRVEVGEAKLVGCRDKDKKQVDKCGTLKFDRVAKSKLASLAKCPSALGLEGDLSIGFEIDFEGNKVTVLKGEDTTLPSSTVRGVLKCAAEEFGEAPLHKVTHTHRYYTVFYTVQFFPPGTPLEAPKPPEEAAEAAGDKDDESTQGMATVSWDTALVRKKPKDGEVVSRLMRGTRVKVLERQDDWFRIDAGMATGWVYKQAIGMN